MKGSRETRFPFLLYPHRLLSVLEVVLEVLGGGAVLRYAQRRGGHPHAWVASSFMLLCMKTSSSFCVKWKSILCKEKLVSILQIYGIVISVGKGLG